MPALDDGFDPYLQWLGISVAERPANYYRLLGLPVFESHGAAIEQAADERMKLVRGFQAGPRGRFTPPLLNELTRAKLCLLSPVAKQAYDEALRQAVGGAILGQGIGGLEDSEEDGRFELPLSAAATGAWQAEPPPIIPAGIATSADDEPEETPAIGASFSPVRMIGLVVAVLVVAISVWALGGWVLSGGRIAEDAPEELQTEDQAESMAGKQSAADDRPDAMAIEVLQEGSGEVLLSPATAALSGQVELRTVGTENVLSPLQTAGDAAEWRFRLVKPGFFQVHVTYAVAEAALGGRLQLEVAGQAKQVELQSSGGPEQFRTADFTLAITKSGSQSLRLQPADDLESAVQVKLIRLEPVGRRDAGEAGGLQSVFP